MNYEIDIIPHGADSIIVVTRSNGFKESAVGPTTSEMSAEDITSTVRTALEKRELVMDSGRWWPSNLQDTIDFYTALSVCAPYLHCPEEMPDTAVMQGAWKLVNHFAAIGEAVEAVR